jgi:hypothetical protein
MTRLKKSLAQKKALPKAEEEVTDLSDGRRQTALTLSGIPISGLASSSPPLADVYQTTVVSRQRMHSAPTGCWPSKAFWQVYMVRQSFPPAFRGIKQFRDHFYNTITVLYVPTSGHLRRIL